jgi:hypothetical protein
MMPSKNINGFDGFGGQHKNFRRKSRTKIIPTGNPVGIIS